METKKNGNSLMYSLAVFALVYKVHSVSGWPSIIFGLVLFGYFGYRFAKCQETWISLIPVLLVLVYDFYRGRMAFQNLGMLVLPPVLGAVAGSVKSQKYMITAVFLAILWPVDTFVKGWLAVVSEPIKATYFTVASGEEVPISADSTYVLEFWYLGCPDCVRAYPNFEKAQKNFAAKPNTVFSLINVPLDGQTLPQILSFMQKRNWRMPNRFAQNLEQVKADWGVWQYPTVLVIKNRQIVYRGKVEGIEKVL